MSNQVAYEQPLAEDHEAVSQDAQPSTRQEASAGQEEEDKPRTICGLTYTTAFKLVVVVLIIVGIVLGLTVGNLDSRLSDLLQWLEDNRLKGILIYIAIYAALTAVFFPSSILTLAGGAIYSFWGIPIVWTGAVLGQTLAFLLSRYLLRDIVKGWAGKYTVWKGINGAISAHPLKITILVRLATVIPYSATNALLPITDMTLWQYTVGSAIGILPGVALFVLIGRLASSIAEVSSGNMSEASNPIIVFTTVGISIVILLILVVLLTKYAKKALAEQLEKDAAAQEAAAPESQTAELDSASAEEVPEETSVPIK